MSNRSRQQRRTEKRELRKLHPKLRKQGLDPVNPSEEMHSLAILFRDILINDADSERVIKVATTAHRILDLTLASNPPPEPHACKASCAYCCHSFTSISAPEAFALARLLSERSTGNRQSLAQQFVERSNGVIGLDADARFDKLRIACPLLIDGHCSAYDARPIACRMYCSFDVECCKASFEGSPDKIPLDRRIFGAGSVIKFALCAALYSCGYEVASYELGEAVTRVLSTEYAVERWTDGENIFSDVQPDKAMNADIHEIISRLAGLLVA